MNFKNINFSFVFQLVAILSLIIIYLFQWGMMITTPSLRTGTDFMAFYSVGRVAQEYGIESSYKISLQQKIQEEVVGFLLTTEQVLIYIHIPAIIPILSLIISENYISSFFIWSFLMFIIYAVAILNLATIIEIKEKQWVMFIGGILFFPFFQSLLLGQDTAILILGMVFLLRRMTQKNDWFGVIGLALISIRPHFCLIFLISIIFYDFRESWKYILAIGLFTLINMFLVGREGTLDFINILQVSASGEGHGTNESSMFNLIGLIARSLPSLDSRLIRGLGWGGYALAILISSFYWTRKEKSLEWLLSFTILVTLFFAPHLHYHDLALLIIPIFILLINHKKSLNTILGISMILLIPKPFYYISPYVLYIGLIWWLWKTKSDN